MTWGVHYIITNNIYINSFRKKDNHYVLYDNACFSHKQMFMSECDALPLLE